MNTAETNSLAAAAEWSGRIDSKFNEEPICQARQSAGQNAGRCAAGKLGQWVTRVMRGEQRPSSILRNNTNLPVFLALALGISLICNFALRENTVQASRFLGAAATLHESQELLAKNPEDAALHSRLGELYLQQSNFKRAMFHFRESSRLNDLFGD